MSLKMGDLVLRRDRDKKILFEITEFDGEYVILRGAEIPIITISRQDNLIKINRERRNRNSIRRMK